MVEKVDNANPQEPANAGQPDGGTQKPDAIKPDAQPTRPEWLKENFKSAEDQAKAYVEAEKAMTKSSQEAARLREENARLNAMANPPAGTQQPQGNSFGNMENGVPQEIPYNVRTKLEARYPGVPAEQIVAMFDVMNAQIQPIKDTIYGSQVESAKASFAKENPLFDRYKGEIEATLSRYPIEERSKRNTIQTVYSWVVNQHLRELEQEWLEQGRKEASIKPTVPSFAGDPGGAMPPQHNNANGVKLTQAQKDMAIKFGLNPDEVEKMNNSGGYK